jgi:alpha/beta superfamily hydrolase
MSMREVVFDRCFGWLHDARGDRGVIICNPYAHEAIWMHRGIRRLAEQLAAAGMPTLRFDYRGTGDACDDKNGADDIAGAVNDIAAAAAWLHESTGAREVLLIGFRLGAALACLAAPRVAQSLEVAGVALLAPVVRGRTYLRELKAVQRTYLEMSGPYVAGSQPQGNFQDVLGFRADEATMAAMTGLDLTTLAAAPAPRALVLSARPAEAQLAESLRALGSQTEAMPFAGFEDFLLEASYSKLPVEALAAVARWAGALPPAARSAATRARQSSSGRAVIELPHATDTPVRLGEQQMFGMLCEPRRARDAAPAVVFANTGRAHHIGEARFATVFARRLAENGVSSLRVDLHNIGDSPLDDGNSLYTKAAHRDLSGAVDWMGARGHRQVVVIGICSGAYLGLQVAQHHDTLAGLVALNPPKLLFPDLADTTPHPTRSTRHYLSSFNRPDKWLKVLRGQSSLMPVIRAVTSLVMRKLKAAAPILPHAAKADDPHARVVAMMERIEARGIATRLVYGALDPGLDDLEAHFGKLGARLGRSPNVRCSTIEDLDHALFSAPARERAMTMCETFLFARMAPVAGSGDARVDAIPAVDVLHATSA